MTTPNLPALEELDSRSRRALLRALAGAPRRRRIKSTSNHPDHDGDDTQTRTRCAACQAEREEELRRRHGADADDRIAISRRLNSNITFLSKCIETIAKRQAADERDAAIEAELTKWQGDIGYVALKTGYPVSQVRRVAKLMKNGDPPAAQRRAMLSAEHTQELRQRLDRARRPDTRARAYELFEAGELRTSEIAVALGVTSGRVSQLKKDWGKARGLSARRGW